MKYLSIRFFRVILFIFGVYTSYFPRLIIISIVISGVLISPVEAANWFEKKITIGTIRTASILGLARPNRTADQHRQLIVGENRLINEVRIDYNTMQKNNAVTAIGVAEIGGFEIAGLADGVSTMLTFMLLNPDSRSIVLFPEIEFIRYYVNLDPTLDLNDPNYDILIGESFDANANYSLAWIIEGFEPQITAIPYNISGQRVVSPGFDGTDVASGIAVNLFIPDVVPEPNILLLLTLGFVCIGFNTRKKK